VTYDQLKKFITEDMQMQHIYQPVMLIELLKNGGHASEKIIAKAILDCDPVQQKYYEDKVRNMVGRVLKKNGITDRVKSEHSLIGYDTLSPTERDELIHLLGTRLANELRSKGDSFWKHRATDREEISGSVRYEVLKRAKGRCECCGISKEERDLDVDHIVPRSKKGINDITNYQALCWLCNTNKGNRDKTDFRGVEVSYSERVEGCLFCDIQTKDRGRIEEENSLAYATRDGFPVTEYHTLIIPKRHTLDFFGLTQAELNAINSLIHSQKKIIEKLDKTVEGFNIGANCGEIAGQSVWHCHIHLIPRRRGDVERPKGGVRHVIPNKGHYEERRLKRL